MMICVKFKESQADKFIPHYHTAITALKQVIVEVCKQIDFWELCSEWNKLSGMKNLFEDGTYNF